MDGPVYYDITIAIRKTNNHHNKRMNFPKSTQACLTVGLYGRISN